MPGPGIHCGGQLGGHVTDVAVVIVWHLKGGTGLNQLDFLHPEDKISQ